LSYDSENKITWESSDSPKSHWNAYEYPLLHGIYFVITPILLVAKYRMYKRKGNVSGEVMEQRVWMAENLFIFHCFMFKWFYNSVTDITFIAQKKPISSTKRHNSCSVLMYIVP
jgi:hypothetical protein